MLLQRSCLALSLAGNAVDVLTVTAPEDDGLPLASRQGVVISGARGDMLRGEARSAVGSASTCAHASCYPAQARKRAQT